jgi:hypothetical protein
MAAGWAYTFICALAVSLQTRRTDDYSLINTNAPNKSLDASGGSVFLIITSPVMLE